MNDQQRERPTPRENYVVKDGAPQAQRVVALLITVIRHPMTLSLAKVAIPFLIAALGAGAVQIRLWTAQHRIEAQAAEAKVKALKAEARVDNTIKTSTNPLVDDVAALRKRLEALEASSRATQDLLLSFVVTGRPSPAKRQLVKVVAANAVKATQDLKTRKTAPLARKVPETVPDLGAKAPVPALLPPALPSIDARANPG